MMHKKLLVKKSFIEVKTLSADLFKVVKRIDLEKWVNEFLFTYKDKEYEFDLDKFVKDYFKEKTNG